MREMLVPLREYYIGVYLEQVRVGLQSGMRPDFVRDETDRRAPSLKQREWRVGQLKYELCRHRGQEQRREPTKSAESAEDFCGHGEKIERVTRARQTGGCHAVRAPQWVRAAGCLAHNPGSAVAPAKLGLGALV